MVGHLFQNYDTIYVLFFPTYTCNHSCYTIYVHFLSRIRAFYSQVYDHFLTNAHIYVLQTGMWSLKYCFYFKNWPSCLNGIRATNSNMYFRLTKQK